MKIMSSERLANVIIAVGDVPPSELTKVITAAMDNYIEIFSQVTCVSFSRVKT